MSNKRFFLILTCMGIGLHIILRLMYYLNFSSPLYAYLFVYGAVFVGMFFVLIRAARKMQYEQAKKITRVLCIYTVGILLLSFVVSALRGAVVAWLSQEVLSIQAGNRIIIVFDIILAGMISILELPIQVFFVPSNVARMLLHSLAGYNEMVDKLMVWVACAAPCLMLLFVRPKKVEQSPSELH